MQLFVIRHAIAAEPSPERPDASRPLTAKGRDRFVEAVRGARKLGWRFDRLYHSPLVRAVQTAELLRPLLDGPAVALPDLARAPDEEMLAHLEGERVAVVGHEPHLGSLVAWLVAGDAERGERFCFKKGGFAVLEGELRPGSMTLHGLVAPKLLRRVGSR
jgi:phosphohistidine phosphatase